MQRCAKHLAAETYPSDVWSLAHTARNLLDLFDNLRQCEIKRLQAEHLKWIFIICYRCSQFYLVKIFRSQECTGYRPHLILNYIKWPCVFALLRTFSREECPGELSEGDMSGYYARRERAMSRYNCALQSASGFWYKNCFRERNAGHSCTWLQLVGLRSTSISVDRYLKSTSMWLISVIC